MAISRDDWDRLKEIQEQMQDLLSEAKEIIRRGPKWNYDRAKSYWLAHVEMGLSNEHSYLGSAGCSMDDTINELEPPEVGVCETCGCDLDEGDDLECFDCFDGEESEAN